MERNDKEYEKRAMNIVQNNDYRQAKALEIIAEELTRMNNREKGLSTLYTDLLIDVENLRKKVEGK